MCGCGKCNFCKMAGIKPRITIKWFELRLSCWECAGSKSAYATLEDVIYELSNDDFTDYHRDISVCTIEAGLPVVYDKIMFSVCELDEIEEADYQEYDYRTGKKVATNAYSYVDDEDTEKVIFIFNEKGY